MTDVFNIGADPLSYSGIGAAKPPILALRVPLSTDIGFDVGQLWVDTNAGSSYTLVSVASGSATWILNGVGGGGGIATITGDSGGAEVPDGGGNFNLLGTGNQVVTAGSANTLTYSLSSTLVAPGSITSTTGITAGTTLTSAGATTLATTGASTNTFGNTTGATSLALRVGAAAFSVDGVTNSTYSIGASTTTGTITIGGTAESGTMTLGSSTAANTEIIAGGSGATTLQIANVQTGGSVSVGAGMTTGTIAIGGTGLQTGTITVGGGTGAQTVNLGTGGTGVKTIHIGDTAAVANVISIGSLTGTVTSNCPTLVTLASGAGTGLAVDTSAGTGIAATFKSTNATTDAIQLLAGSGGIKTAATSVAAGASPQTCNNRFGQVVFSGVSIAGGATQSFEVDNTTVTGASTVVFVTMYGATTGSAPVIQSVTPAASKFTVVVSNGDAGSTTTTANITFTFWVMT